MGKRARYLAIGVMVLVWGLLAALALAADQVAAPAAPKLDLQTWINLGALITALVPFLTAAAKKFLGPTKYTALLPLAIGVITTAAGGMAAGQIHGLADLLPVVVTGIIGGGVGSSARDVFRKTLASAPPVGPGVAGIFLLILLTGCAQFQNAQSSITEFNDKVDAAVEQFITDVKTWNTEEITEAKAIADAGKDVALSTCLQCVLDMRAEIDAITLTFDLKKPLPTYASIRQVRRMFQSTERKEQLNNGCGALAADETKAVFSLLGKVGLAVGTGGLSLPF